MVSTLAHAQWTTITASKITDGSASNHLLAGGQLCATGTDANGKTINFQVGGGGQNVNHPYCQTVTDGALTGGLDVPDAMLTIPQKICYKLELTNDNGALLRTDIQCGGVITGATWDYDALVPTSPTPPTPSVPAMQIGTLTLQNCIGPGCGGGSGGSTFVDGETPTGPINSSNTTYTLAQTPNPSSSLVLMLNGMILTPSVDFTLAGQTVSLALRGPPQTGDVLLASYRTFTASGTVTFVDFETPSGTINGINLVFGVANAPNPSGSLLLIRNGFPQIGGGVDYTLSGSTITFTSGAQPQTGDILRANYRY